MTSICFTCIKYGNIDRANECPNLKKTLRQYVKLNKEYTARQECEAFEHV